MSENE